MIFVHVCKYTKNARPTGIEMDKNRKILITSCKGGVGKSTVTANLGYALALRGKKTLVIDFDLGNRTLDLILGCENKVLYDFCDLALGRVDARRAVIEDRRSANLYFCAAPARYGGDLDEAAVGEAIKKLEDEFDFDFILIDTSGGADKSVFLSAPFCKEALIITSQQPASVRAAEKSGVLLDEYGVAQQHLVINCFDCGADKESGRTGIIEIIDMTRTPIIGVIPYEQRLMLKQEKGLLSGESGKAKKSNASAAFSNIAARLCGEKASLFKGFRKINRKRLLG